MTTPGGDSGAAAPSGAVEPVPGVRRGPDRIALLAWTVAVVLALVMAGLAVVGVRAIGAQREVISDWWATAVAGTEAPPPYVEPLPGPPPVDRPGASEEAAAKDAGRVIVNPSWRVQPRSVYPNRAQRQGVESGRVELRCPVSAEGQIKSCWILSETPADAGFGQAALAGAVQARLQPRTVDGVAVPTTISFTMRFRLE
ncbi:MAG: TonB family protein [Brevundimonas sp.]|jgi:TonB family protein|uniref:energy transducer TonB n=1 Tax=Brevundimonas sp. TaxID=1871086 RepID=UPI002489B4FC|nr:energy transducer TonB [Brevundimonas sp.]MDI1282633.1 energy transducer TonB [Brevundimonas sp.]